MEKLPDPQFTQEQQEWLRETAQNQGIVLEGGPSEQYDQLLELVKDGILKLYE